MSVFAKKLFDLLKYNKRASITIHDDGKIGIGESWDYEYGYEYDSQGNMIKKIAYDSDGSIDSWTEYIYE